MDTENIEAKNREIKQTIAMIESIENPKDTWDTIFGHLLISQSGKSLSELLKIFRDELKALENK